ncbi:Mpv17/PMP22 family protein [Stagonosporopsis vannaccii]|nr:Mpv17/PMP22 family protein [Stagonosporopsis vannaccii]
MISSASAWARASSRRTTQFTHGYPRHPSQHPGNTTRHFAAPRATPARVQRRHNASKPQNPSAAPPTTIPGPAWLWLEPVIEPFRAYGRVQQRKPYLTQLVSSLVIYFVGDLVAQGIAEPEHKESDEGEDKDERGWVQEWSEDRDWARTGRALVIGGISSIPSYKWFLWLSMNFNYGSKILSLTTKVVVNQLFFTPIFNSYFFGMQTLLAGASFDEIVERIKHTVPTSWINSCKLWPAVTAFSFTYIPIQYRSIFGGVIAIGWQTYLSLLNQRAAAQEHTEHEGAVHVQPTRAVAERESIGEKEKCAA